VIRRYRNCKLKYTNYRYLTVKHEPPIAPRNTQLGTRSFSGKQSQSESRKNPGPGRDKTRPWMRIRGLYCIARSTFSRHEKEFCPKIVRILVHNFFLPIFAIHARYNYTLSVRLSVCHCLLLCQDGSCCRDPFTASSVQPSRLLKAKRHLKFLLQ